MLGYGPACGSIDGSDLFAQKRRQKHPDSENLPLNQPLPVLTALFLEGCASETAVPMLADSRPPSDTKEKRNCIGALGSYIFP